MANVPMNLMTKRGRHAEMSISVFFRSSTGPNVRNAINADCGSTPTMLEAITASEDEHSEQRNASPIARMIARMLASVDVSRPFADGRIYVRAREAMMALNSRIGIMCRKSWCVQRRKRMIGGSSVILRASSPRPVLQQASSACRVHAVRFFIA